jgi:hypothetical protein
MTLGGKIKDIANDGMDLRRPLPQQSDPKEPS